MYQKQSTKPIHEKLQMYEQLPIIKKYLEFERLPYPQKQFIWREWNEYYKKVRESLVFEVFKNLEKNYKEKKMAKFKELFEEFKQMRLENALTTLQKPQGIDPMTFYHDQSVLHYKSLKFDAQNEKSVDF